MKPIDSSASRVPARFAADAAAGAAPSNRLASPSSNEPFSSRMMREAVFFPTPGMRCTAATSCACTAATRPAGENADSAASATFGPTPPTPMSRSNRAFSSSARNPYSASASSRTCKNVCTSTGAPASGSFDRLAWDMPTA